MTPSCRLMDPMEIKNLLLVEITERSSTRVVPMYGNAFINCSGVLPPPASRLAQKTLWPLASNSTSASCRVRNFPHTLENAQ
jgi:hypothetical protein